MFSGNKITGDGRPAGETVPEPQPAPESLIPVKSPGAKSG
jgi:hypothetical protein